MKTQTFLLAMAAAPSALAHTVWTHFYIDGVSQGAGVAMRMSHDADKAGFPLEDLSSNDMACGFYGTEGVSRVQPVPDASTLTFEFHSWPDDWSKESLDPGHKGPCAVYLKKVDSATNDTAYGDGWFKIWDDGYNADDDQWCTDKMINNNGRLSVVLPSNLEGGYYLARPEILALHNAVKGDPQFYAGCAQIFLESSGNLRPESTVSIPGYVKAGEDSVSFNIYNNNNTNYPVPGPNVASLVTGAQAAGDQTKQAEGLLPSGAILENANWYATEVPSYTDEAGCWKANQNCWDQDKTCWNPYSPIGGAGCKIWEAHCQKIEDACNAGNFNDPPNKGKNLNPAVTTIEIGLVMATSGVSGSPKTSAAGSQSTKAAYTSAAAASSAAASSKGGYGGVQETAIAAGISDVPKTSEAAPAPTSVSGVKYETIYTTVVKTEVVYTTIYQKKRDTSALRYARRGY